MAADRTIKRNDTGDVIAYDCTNIPDTVASAVFMMKRIGGTTLKVDAAATFTANDDESGRASYTLDGTDTDTTGRYRGEFELTLDDGNVVSYPVSGYIEIWIKEDLG